MQWLCIEVPRLALEVYTRGGIVQKPVAITTTPGRHAVIVQCNEAAHALGISAGMTLSAAYALAAGLAVHARDEVLERKALERIALWAGQFSSYVSLEPPQAVLLEVGGSARLFGGAERLYASAQDGVAALGYHAVLVSAPTPLGAALLARCGTPMRVHDHSALQQRLRSVAIDVLPLPERSLQCLRKMGVEDLGACLRLPRAGLTRRLGAELPVLLDRALGRVPDPRLPFLAPERFESRLPLPGFVEHVEALLFGVHRLVLELAGFLSGRQGGVQRCVLELVGERNTLPVIVSLATPTRDPEHMMEVLRARLEPISLPEPVQELYLRAERIVSLAPAGRDLFQRREGGATPLAALLDRLRARLGEQAVHGVEWVPDHRPERAWRWRLPEPQPSPLAPAPPGARPLWLLLSPQLLPIAHGHPCLEGPLHLVRGPERIASGWWDGDPVQRDYFVARDPAGAQLWIFQERYGARCWFLHGIFEDASITR